jgi:hypothetical protein
MLDVIMAGAKKGTHRIVSTTEEGDVATLKVLINEKEQVFRMIKEEGAWRLDAAEDLAKVKKALEFLKGLKEAAERMGR